MRLFKIFAFQIYIHVEVILRAKSDANMKIGRDWKFDTLKKVKCRPKLKNAPK